MSDIAWAAGIYEGEGYCKYGKRTFSVIIGQKDDWLLKKLKRLFGGSIYYNKSGKQIPRWAIHGARARGFIYTIFSYMSPRRRYQLREKLAYA